MLMKKRIATAFLIAGFVPDVAVVSPKAFAQENRARTASQQLVQPAFSWHSRFGHLKSAGRFRRARIAGFALEDGRLWAEWSGHVLAPEPRLLETEELDAEWMA